MTHVDVTVDELVVDGLGGVDPDALRAATADELERLLGGRPPSVRAAAETERLGRAVAAAVRSEIAPRIGRRAR